jgi:hypothetical protein
MYALRCNDCIISIVMRLRSILLGLNFFFSYFLPFLPHPVCLYLLYVARDVIKGIYQLLYFTATLNGQYSAHSSVQPAQ